MPADQTNPGNQAPSNQPNQGDGSNRTDQLTDEQKRQQQEQAQQ